MGNTDSYKDLWKLQNVGVDKEYKKHMVHICSML
jgi:hypothetical protein